MKKILLLLALAVGLTVPMLNAGSLSTLAPGQGGGQNQKDGTNLQGVVETYQRGWSCSVWTNYQPVSGVSTLLNLTSIAGVSAAGGYYGPILLKIQNIALTADMVIYTTRTSAATGDTLTAQGEYIQSYSATTGNLSRWSAVLAQGEYGHVRGLTGSGRISACGCHLNN